MSADVERRNPFVGLRPFFDEDAFYFFGRGEQTTDLLQLLHEHRFVPVLGSSGSGKSSLVRAGLIPMLQGGFMVSERDGWRMTKCRPGEAPLENLAEALQYAMGEGRAPASAALLAQRMREEHTDAILEYVRPRLKGTENLFILVDQFEELFAFRSAGGGEGDDESGMAPHAERIAERIRRRQDASSLVSLLLALSRQKELPVYVSITMRTDFLGDCDLFEGLPEAINKSGYLVPRLTRTQLRECVVGPARLHGAQVAPRLVDRVLNDVGDRGDQLPVLQHALLRTWERWEAGGRVGPLDLVHFDGAGGLNGALAQQADEITASADPVMVERLFKRLTTTDARRRRVRSPARLSELITVSGAPPDAVKALLARCVAEGVNFLYAAPDGKPGDPRYDIVHESLIRQWPTLRAWVDEERDLRDWWLEMARRAAADAASPGEDLLSSRAVQHAEERLAKRSVTEAWAARYAGQGLSYADTMAFLVRSRNAVTGRRLRRIRAIGATVLGFVVLGVYGLYNGWLADRTLRTSLDASRRVAIERLSIDDPTYATALAAEFTREELQDTVVLRLVQKAMHGIVATAEYDSVDDVALSDDGVDLAMTVAGSILIRRADGAGGIVRIPVDSEHPSTMRFSRSGTSLLVGFHKGHVRRYNRRDGRLEKAWTVSPEQVTVLTESPDGQHLVALDSRTAVYAWGASAERVDSLYPSGVTFVEFDPTTKATLIVGRATRGTKLLRVDLTSRQVTASLDPDSSDAEPLFVAINPVNGEAVVGWRGTRASVYSATGKRKDLDAPLSSGVAYSPDGTLLAIGTAVGVVDVYDARSLERLWHSTPHTQYVTVGFSSNSEAVVSIATDRSGRWTPVRDTSRSVLLNGHREDLSTLLMAPGASRFVTRDVGGVVRVWDTPVDWSDVTPPLDTAALQRAVLSEDGRVVLSGFDDGSVLAQFPATDRPSIAMPRVAGPAGGFDVLAVSPDGQRAFVGAEGGSYLWTLTSAPPTPLGPNMDGRIDTAVFSGDGRTVVVAQSDGRVRQVDAMRGTVRSEVIRCPASMPVGQIAVSADGGRIAVWCDGDDTVTVRTPNGTLRQSIEGINPLRTLRFAPDSTTLLASGVGYSHLLVDTRVADRYRWLQGRQWEVYAAAFSRDGRLIATAGYDKTVELFDMPTFEADSVDAWVLGRQLLTGHRFPVMHVAFSNEDNTIVSTGINGAVHLWQANATGMYVGRELTHPRPLPPSSLYVEQVASAYLSAKRMVTSLALSWQGGVNGEREYTVARYNRWDLDPDRLLARLQQRNTVCIPLDVRRNLIPVERDLAAERTTACRQRIGRGAK